MAMILPISTPMGRFSKRHVGLLAIVVSMALLGGTTAAGATSYRHVERTAVVIATSLGDAGISLGKTVRSVSSGGVSLAPGSQPTAEKRIPLDKLKQALKWLKDKAPTYYSVIKSKVKAGWAAFNKWWTQTVPGWVRTGVEWFIGSSVWDWFTALKDFFF
jgi:hypothetical protein